MIFYGTLERFQIKYSLKSPRLLEPARHNRCTRSSPFYFRFVKCDVIVVQCGRYQLGFLKVTKYWGNGIIFLAAISSPVMVTVKPFSIAIYYPDGAFCPGNVVYRSSCHWGATQTINQFSVDLLLRD